MKTFKIFLAILLLNLMSSCASFQLDTLSTSVVYRFNDYDYNSINYIYIHNPSFFYNSTYVDRYGYTRYYYEHPYYIRYCQTRHIKPYRPQSVNHIIPSMVRRTQINNNHTTPINNIRTPRTSNIRTPSRVNNHPTSNRRM